MRFPMSAEPLAMVVSDGKPPVTTSVDASAALCEHVQTQGLQCHLFSDITLSFCGKEHQLHRIILSQSSYFFSLLSGPWKEHGKSRIFLQIDDPNVTSEGLEIALRYMYGVTPVFTGENVISVLAAGCFLCLENLCEKCAHFIVEDLKVETFVNYQQLSERHCYGRFADFIRNACWTFLCTHASGELLHLLPKFSLQVLCLLLRSDELWVPNESERYKLSKQVLTNWKLARVKTSYEANDCPNQKKIRIKPCASRKSVRNSYATAGTRTKSGNQRANRLRVKDRCGRKKELEVAVADEEKPSSAEEKEEIVETELRRLQRLWEEGDPSDLKEESFKSVVDLFTAGGIIFAHMEPDEVLQAKKELEDAGLSPDAANDSMWHNTMLQTHVLKFRDANLDDSSDDDVMEDNVDDDDDDDDDDEVDFEDEDDTSERDSSDSDGWSTDHSSQAEADDESNSSDTRHDGGAGTSGQACKRLKTQNTSIVCFTCTDSQGISEPLQGSGDGKRRRTTGGFTWVTKPVRGMQLSDFPPFRFGTEFLLKDQRWVPCLDISSEVFYGGSMWMVCVNSYNREKEDWVCSLQCRPLDKTDPHTYKDSRRRVPFMAKVYIKTCQGLRCVSGTAVRKPALHVSRGRHAVSMVLSRKDVIEGEPLRVTVVVQLIDD